MASAQLWNKDLGDPNAGTVELRQTEGFATVLGRAVGVTRVRASVATADSDVEVRVVTQQGFITAR